MMTENHFQQFLAAAHRAGDERLMLCSSGNLSWRVDNEVLISGTGSWLPTIKKEQIAILDLATGTTKNGIKPSMEHGFHLGVLRERSDVNVVLHFQSQYATAIACMKEKPTNFNVSAEIPCHIGTKIPIIPYYRPGSIELAQAVIHALVNHDACLLSKHGQVVAAKDFESAFEKAVFFEMACRIMIQSGMNYTLLTPQEIEDLEIYILGKKTK
ncbi:MAG: class II aldolase/adducin family protein [Bacteroidales bacterium]|nr:class II aldolase/adducin family protein [Bacteroidales bacterium]